MTTWNTLDIITGSFAITGCIVAVYEIFKRRKLELFTKGSLQSIAGNIQKIKQSTSWTYNNLREAQEEAIKLPQSGSKNLIIKKLSYGLGDGAAADRMTQNLLNELLNLQKSQFGTTEITHPDKKDFEPLLGSN